MESRRWTDERLDDLAQEVRGGFDRVDRDIRELRQMILGGGAVLIGTQMIVFLGVITTILARGA